MNREAIMITVTRSALPRSSRLALAGALSLAALLPAACARSAADPGVRTVEAQIDGITCAACVPPLTASLRKHFKDAGITVDDETDTATLTLKSRDAFTPAEFERAVADVRMRVVAMSLEACGQAAGSGAQRVLDAGGTRFVLRGEMNVPTDTRVCVRGSLDASQDPAALDVTAVTLAGS